MTNPNPIRPALLAILDGYGLADAHATNAVTTAASPYLSELFVHGPLATTLDASGEAVGLPPGQMGNSEVGHLNIGAGRVVYQELTRIDKAIADGSFFENPALIESFDTAIGNGKTIHLMGLVSDGGVHSHMEHLKALVRMAADRGASRILVHAFLDGRDVPPRSGQGYIQELQDFLQTVDLEWGHPEIGTIMGRYFAMDRDNRWDRVERAYNPLVWATEAAFAYDPVSAVGVSYSANINDEFMNPIVVASGGIRDGDAVVFFNFRPDRGRELTRAFVDPDFDGFPRGRLLDLEFVTLTEYDPTLPVKVAFPKEFPENVLADVIADAGMRQLHIAETEKYAHVTFFFNGGVEEPKEGEERILIPSPKVATYDLKPEMSAPEVTDALVDAIRQDRADVYIVNFANCDMVGHTGVFEAACRAVEAVDAGVSRAVDAIVEKGGFALVTADHGNAECMLDPADDETPFTAHTLSPVPLALVVGEDALPEGARLDDGGILADIAPTLIDLMGLEQPVEWTGRSLLIRP